MCLNIMYFIADKVKISTKSLASDRGMLRTVRAASYKSHEFGMNEIETARTRGGFWDMSTEAPKGITVNRTYLNNTREAAAKPETHHELEMYLIPSIMACPLLTTLFIIYKLYKKLQRLRHIDSVSNPILRLEAFETDL